MRLRIGWFIAVLLLGGSSAWAGNLSTLKIDHSPDTLLPLHTYCEFFQDSAHKYEFDQVREFKSGEAPFQRFTEPVTNLNFTSSRYWVHFMLHNTSSDQQDFYLETGRPLTNTVNLYLISTNGTTTKLLNGDGIPFAKRVVKDRRVLFPIHLEAGEYLHGYVELISDGEIITVPMRLWPKNAFLKQNGIETLFHGIYYGVLVLVLVLFTFFFIAMREKVFLYYVTYVFSLCLFQFTLDGYSFQYFWPNMVWWANHALLFFTSITVLTVLLYAQAFLQLKKYLPRINRVFSTLQVLALIVLLGSLTDGPAYELAFPLINFLSLVSTLLILFTLVIAHFNRITVSPFFPAAFLFLMLGGIYFILGNVNIIDNTPITENAIKFGSVLEIILLSISMAGRYKNLQRDKEIAQQSALEKLEEMNRLKDQINVELESQVKERTAKIERQNDELAEKNKDITDSIRYAKRIQEAILPSRLTVEIHLPDSFIFYRPKDIVSGDFYWLRDSVDKVLFAVVDCTGHGVPGAFMSIVGQNGLNQAVDEYQLNQPGKILDHLNQVVALTLKQKETDNQVRDGMDIALCSLNRSNSILEFAGANNPLWVVSPEMPVVESDIPMVTGLSNADESLSLYSIKADKQPIGAYVDREPNSFTNHRIRLRSGDTFYLFSDGFADQFGGPKEKKFKHLPLKRLLLELHSKPMKEQHSVLNATFDDWKGDLEQLDDVCIIGVRVT